MQKCSDTERIPRSGWSLKAELKHSGSPVWDKALSSAPMRICHRDQRLLKGLPPLKRREERVNSVAWIPRRKACSQKTRFIYLQPARPADVCTLPQEASENWAKSFILFCLRQVLFTQPWLAWSLRLSCWSLTSAGVTDVPVMFQRRDAFSSHSLVSFVNAVLL